MRRLLPLAAALVLPVVALAVDMTDATSRYTDRESMSQAELAAVSVLTNASVVQGNEDGSFAPGRTLNRAEFLKIALLGNGGTGVNAGEADNCFPDVPSDAWFSAFVCFSKKQGIVQGYPDGLFHPERAVNYAEALKILTLLFAYNLPEPEPNERWAWYTQYVRAAAEYGVALSDNPDAGTFLTRGQMARLAAAFMAQNDGELEAYRAAERGEALTETSSSVVSSSSSVSSQASSAPAVIITSSTASSSSAAASSVGSSQRHPAVSRQLYLGSLSLPIADGTLTSAVDADVRIVNMRLRRQVESVTQFSLVDSTGTQIAVLERRSADPVDNKYRNYEALLPEAAFQLKAGVSKIVGIQALLKSREGGGIPQELIEVESFSVIAQAGGNGASEQILPTAPHYPMHQTVQGRITSIQNALGGGNLKLGKKMQVASLQFAGALQPGASLAVTQLQLAVESSGITLQNWYVATTDRPETFGCTYSAQISMVFCDSIGTDAGNIGTGVRTLHLYVDVALASGATEGALRVSLGDPGTVGRTGAVTWYDGGGTLSWIDWPTTPVLQGPLWNVRP